MQIGELLPVPCGGTHVSNIQEIGRLMIHGLKKKGIVTKISYEVL